MGQTSQQSGRSKPLDDLTYDLVAVLHEKSKGLEAYDKYLRDAGRDEEVRKVLSEIRQQDIQAVQRLRKCVAKFIGQAGQGDLESDEGDLESDEAGHQPTV